MDPRVRASQRIEALVLLLVDRLYARLPQTPPARQRLQTAKIIAHRGIHDNIRILENTSAAFKRALDAGI